MIRSLLAHGNGYHVHDLGLVGLMAVCIAVLPLIGFAVIQLKSLPVARSVAWFVTIASVVVVERLSLAEPSGTRMLLIISALLLSMKMVVAVEAKPRNNEGAEQTWMPLMNWLAFASLWFGMRPRLFSNLDFTPRSGWVMYVIRGLIRIAIGALLFGAAWILVFGFAPNMTVTDPGTESNLPEWRRWIATGCLMMGLSFFVHFGLFNVLVGFWRRLGVKCTPLFRAPMLSQSLTEFWGRRWNLAFSEMTALAVFRPLKSWFGKGGIGQSVATVSAFLFSGLLHELAISVPVQSGYGLPMIYFAIHGFGMFLESRFLRNEDFILNRLWVGRIWTWLWVLVPLPLLFHRAFLEGCVWPLIGLVGQ